MATYEDILTMRLGDFKDVPPIPVGTYLATITTIPKIDKFGRDQKQGAEYSFKLVEPQGDVDPEALQEAGGLPEEPMTYTFWLTKKAGIIIQRFLLDVIGIAPGTSLPDGIAQCQGEQCLVSVIHGTSKKTGRAFAMIDGFAKAQ